MSKTYLPYDPDQPLLLPQALQEWLPEDHLAYFTSDIVDQLDTSEITACHEQERWGGPPYNFSLAYTTGSGRQHPAWAEKSTDFNPDEVILG